MNHNPVTGPFRVSIDAMPGGARLDISHYLATVILALAQAADEEGPSVLEDLQHIAELDRSAGHRGIDSHATHERDAAVQRLLEDIGEGQLPVYGGEVLRLVESLRACVAPKAVPAQQDRRSA